MPRERTHQASPISPRLKDRSAGRSNSATGLNLAQSTRVAHTLRDRFHSRHRLLAAGALVFVGVLVTGVFGAESSAAARVASPVILSLTTSPQHVSARGGSVGVHVRVRNARSCAFRGQRSRIQLARPRQNHRLRLRTGDRRVAARSESLRNQRHHPLLRSRERLRRADRAADGLRRRRRSRRRAATDAATHAAVDPGDVAAGRADRPGVRAEPRRLGRNAALRMVDRLRGVTGRLDPVGGRDDLGHADDTQPDERDRPGDRLWPDRRADRTGRDHDQRRRCFAALREEQQLVGLCGSGWAVHGRRGDVQRAQPDRGSDSHGDGRVGRHRR